MVRSAPEDREVPQYHSLKGGEPWEEEGVGRHWGRPSGIGSLRHAMSGNQEIFDDEGGVSDGT